MDWLELLAVQGTRASLIAQSVKRQNKTALPVFALYISSALIIEFSSPPRPKVSEGKLKGSISFFFPSHSEIPSPNPFLGEGNGTLLQYSCLENWTEEPGRLQSMGPLRVRHD